MLRVLLVDDEPLALEGLKLLIDWESEGFEICCECASGSEALEQFPISKPDLIVTDIRMPGMSGLELLHTLRQKGFDGQFLIVSGYSDFDYAKGALRIGVAGYLLKPVETADASAVLAHIRRKLIDRDSITNRSAKAIHRAISVLLTEADTPMDDIPVAAHWYLATWGAPLPYPDVQALLALLPKYKATVHITEDKEYLVLRLQEEDEAPDFRGVSDMLSQRSRRFILSKPVGNPADLFVLRKQLSDELDKTFRGALTGQVDALIRTIALRQADECAARCTELEACCAAYGANVLSQARRQLLSACVGLLSDRAEATEAFLRSQDADILPLCLHAIQLLAPEQERISDRMERYAREHSNEQITVNSVAAALKYNPTYIGRKFLEERGIGFRDWLIKQRMIQGAELLRDTNRTIVSIAKDVGYEHYKRFLQHFKRYYGETPEQYRRQRPRA